MKVILDVSDQRHSFFLELVNSLGFVKVVKEIKSKRKEQAMEDLVEAFEDVRLHQQGKKKLRSAEDLMNEL